MASLGYYLLLTAFVVCAYAAAISVAGARRRSTALVESGVGAFYLVAAIMATASAIIEYLFISGDYSVVYVQHYSDSVQPLFYRITSYWGGLDGSIMFWVFMLSLFGAAAVYVNRERHRELIPYVVAVIAVVEMFFLFLMVVHNNPFQTFLTERHPDGNGLNPLLQNYYMAIHPPTLYLGFVGLTIPYAFGMAALITGHLDDAWLVAVRRWTMISWLFLSLGLMLGMLWAYEVLGWGGYWGWDPVENAAALPWFTATAFLHSVMVQERRGMLRVWNVTLVIITFFLTIVGTFLTRSGVVQSVHAFGDDPALARLFAAFMVTILVVSFGFVIYRLPLLRARNDLDSWVSREAAFLVNNWILLMAALFILFATVFPTITEAVTGERITVGAPFYNKWMLPIGLTLLVLTGIGPLLAWRKTTLINLRNQFLVPVVTSLVVFGVVVALGVRIWSAAICFAFCGFVTATIVQEFWRGARVRQGATGTDLFTALVGLVARNRRRYGGYIVHVGIVLIFLGFAGNGFKREETALLKQGQQMKVGDYVIRYGGLKVTDDGQKQMVTASVTALDNGKEVARMYPARWFFRKHESEPRTMVAIRRAFGEDIYIVLAAFTPQDQTASLEVVINPLVNWVWLGFGVLACGTVIAFLPESAFAFATATVPAGAATAGMLILALVLWPATLRAQTPEQQSGHMVFGNEFAPLENRLPVEKSVGRKLICMCGDAGCGKQLAGECACSFAANMRMEISQMAHQGKTEDQIVGFYLAKYGSSEVLAEPPNRGFDRLSWLFPYAVGLGGLVTIFFVTRRWTHPSTAAAGPDVQVDPELDARLDDELRNLD